MPKYWGKQIFSHGSFPKVGEKQKTWKRKKEKESRWKQWPASLRPPPRVAHASTPGPTNYLFISFVFHLTGNFSWIYKFSVSWQNFFLSHIQPYEKKNCTLLCVDFWRNFLRKVKFSKRDPCQCIFSKMIYI